MLHLIMVPFRGIGFRIVRVALMKEVLADIIVNTIGVDPISSLRMVPSGLNLFRLTNLVDVNDVGVNSQVRKPLLSLVHQKTAVSLKQAASLPLT